AGGTGLRRRPRDAFRGLPTTPTRRLFVLVGEAGGTLPFGVGEVPWETYFTTSLWGSIADLRDVVYYAQTGLIDWHVEELPLADANEALERLRHGDVVDRLVLNPCV